MTLKDVSSSSRNESRSTTKFTEESVYRRERLRGRVFPNRIAILLTLKLLMDNFVGFHCSYNHLKKTLHSVCSTSFSVGQKLVSTRDFLCKKKPLIISIISSFNERKKFVFPTKSTGKSVNSIFLGTRILKSRLS